MYCSVLRDPSSWGVVFVWNNATKNLLTSVANLEALIGNYIEWVVAKKTFLNADNAQKLCC